MAQRTLRHTRNITVNVYSRDDSLWDIEARLVDTKDRDYALESGPRTAGDPVHDMRLSLTVDTQFNVLESSAVTDWSPYPGYCNAYEPAVYARLVGLNLLKDFRRQVKSRIAPHEGCTHLSELTQVLPTALVQAMAGDVIDTQGAEAEGAKPFQIDRCHALASNAPAVLRYYPKWYRKPDETHSTP
jgi:hypothetical protein